jgi:hypothetical protein
MTESATSTFNENSLVGIGGSIVTVVVLGFVFSLVPGVSPQAQGSALAIAAGLPATIAYAWQGRRRDTTDDAALIRQGQLRRPIALVVVMFAATLFAFEQIGMFSGHGFGLLGLSLAFLLAMVADFFIASYASHFLGEHSYRWTAVAVVCAYVAQLLLLLSASRYVKSYGNLLKIYGNPYWQGEARLGTSHVVLGLGYLATLGVCLAGAWYGRLHHEKFLAKKLVRMELKAETAAAKRQPTTTQTGTPDLLDQLTKLAGLRDAGVLTDEEFQAKKTEILARI